MMNLKRLNDYEAQISNFITEIYLDLLSEPTVSGDEIAYVFENAFMKALQENNEYFKAQYEKTKTVLEHLGMTDKRIKFDVEIEKDTITGEQYFTIPNDILNNLQWKEGDNLEWVNQNDGSFIIRKVENDEE